MQSITIYQGTLTFFPEFEQDFILLSGNSRDNIASQATIDSRAEHQHDTLPSCADLYHVGQYCCEFTIRLALCVPSARKSIIYISHGSISDRCGANS